MDVIHSSPESSPVLSPVFDTFPTKSSNQQTTTSNSNNSHEELNSVNASTLALLKEHGIAMQEDTDNTLITSALQSGRQLVLSDAGKLLLNDPKFRKSIPTIGKQSNMMINSTSTKTPLTPVTAKSRIKFEYFKQKPSVQHPTSNTKSMPLETNKVTEALITIDSLILKNFLFLFCFSFATQVIKILSAEEFKLMYGNNSGNFIPSKTPGLIR